MYRFIRDAAGALRAPVRHVALLHAMLVLMACGSEQPSAPSQQPDDGNEQHGEVLDDVISPLSLVTYDGSGQTVHPDVVSVPADWIGTRRYLAITPYPAGDGSKENPSIFGGDDIDVWRAPAGLTNPVVRPAGGYLSDPDIVYEPQRRELWMYYREV